MPTSIRELVLIHVRAEGPTTYSEIVRWVDEQSPLSKSRHDAEVMTVAAMNELLRTGRIELYDNGVSFVGCEV